MAAGGLGSWQAPQAAKKSFQADWVRAFHPKAVVSFQL